MKLLLQDKKVDVIDYQTKKQLSVVYPMADLPAVTKVISDARERAIFQAQMKDKSSCVYKAVVAGRRAHAALETGVSKDEMTAKVLEVFNRDIGCDIDELWGQEEWLVYPGAYKGKFDGVGVYQGKVTLFDHKKTNKRKTPSQLRKYYMQLMAYKQAHELMYPGHLIEQVSVFNIYGTTPDEVGTRVITLSIDEMNEMLSLFNSRLEGLTYA